MNRRRYMVGAVAGIATITMLAAPSFGATWRSSAGSPADVCFTAQGLPTAASQSMALAAQEWNTASTNLNVTAGQCASGTNVVPMGPGSFEGTTLGQTGWSSQGDNFIDVSITYDVADIEGWAGDEGWMMVTCHEMGHALGLEHVDANDDPDSCMRTGTSSPITVPSAKDLANIRSLYGGQAKQQKAPVQKAPVQQQQATLGTPASTNARTATSNTPKSATTQSVVSSAPGVVVAPWQSGSASRTAQQSAPTTTTNAGQGNATNVGTAMSTGSGAFNIDDAHDEHSHELAEQWRSQLRN